MGFEAKEPRCIPDKLQLITVPVKFSRTWIGRLIDRYLICVGGGHASNSLLTSGPFFDREYLLMVLMTASPNDDYVFVVNLIRS